MNRVQTILSTVVFLFATAKAADRLNLSREGYEAYFDLMQAQTFSDVLVGFAPRVSSEVEAFRILMQEPGADSAFKQLVAHARSESLGA